MSSTDDSGSVIPGEEITGTGSPLFGILNGIDKLLFSGTYCIIGYHF